MGNNVSSQKQQRSVKQKKGFSLGSRKQQPPPPPPPPSRTPRFALPSQKKAIAEAEAARQQPHRFSLRHKKGTLRRVTSDPTNAKTRHKSKVAPAKTKKRFKKSSPPPPPPSKKEKLLNLTKKTKRTKPMTTSQKIKNKFN